jgi:uncharacterized damage-inducible protein DinB
MTDTQVKTHLARYLDRVREDLLWKLEGLSEYDQRRPLTPTGTNLLGLVKHAAYVESGYLGVVFDRPFLETASWDADPDPTADLWAKADESREDILALYERVGEHSARTISELEIDSPGRVPWWNPERADVTLGQILVHLVTELNRHAGHADIVRELIDGAAGLRRDVSNLPSLDESGWKDQYDKLERLAREAGGRDSG